MSVYILGAGPVGLALVDGLCDASDIPFTIFDRSATVGGLAQTLTWNNYGHHDLGPHKIFSIDENILNRVQNLLEPEDWLVRPKKSRIFMAGHFLPYPPSPFSLLGVYGMIPFLKMTMGYILSYSRNLIIKKETKTFEEDLRSRVGNELYEKLFQPIALKLWGDPNQLDVKLSLGRVQTPSITEIITQILGIKKDNRFEAHEFIYPRNGLQSLWDSIYTKTKGQGQFLLDSEIDKIEVKNKRVQRIHYKNRMTKERNSIGMQEQDFIFSTLPLGLLSGMMGDAISHTTRQQMREIVQLNDLLLVFLKINKLELFEDSWIFVPDPDIVFHRVSEQNSFDPNMTPNGSIVCCEIMSSENRRMDQETDEYLIALAKNGLHDMGIEGFEVEAEKVIRLPKSYPVFRPGFETALQSILTELDQFENFRTVGRQGAFNYIGTLDAMDIGYGASNWFMTGKTAWHKERVRTSFYPVLD